MEEGTVSQREPRVHLTLYKLCRSNAALLAGKVQPKEKEERFKEQIGELLQSEVGHFQRDLEDAEIVSEDSTESHRAQMKVVEDLNLVAIKKN